MEATTVYLLQDRLSVRKAMDSALIAAGHRVLLSTSLREFLANYIYDSPGCVVVDLVTPGANEQVQSELARRRLAPQVVYVAENVNEIEALEAFGRGSVDVLLEPPSPSALIAAVTKALARDSKARSIARAKKSVDSLTTREREVLSHIVQRTRAPDTAKRLGIPVSTVKSHRERLMRKLGLCSVAELTRFTREVDVVEMVRPSSGLGREEGAPTRAPVEEIAPRVLPVAANRPNVPAPDLEKRLLAAGICELHALLSRHSNHQQVIIPTGAEELVRSLYESALLILDAQQVEVTAALNSLQQFESMLGPECLCRVRQAVLGQSKTHSVISSANQVAAAFGSPSGNSLSSVLLTKPKSRQTLLGGSPRSKAVRSFTSP